MNQRPPHSTPRWGLGIALGLLCTLLLALGHRHVGYVRDEGIYFEASRHYAAWVVTVTQQPHRLADRTLRDRHFGINREHPALMKTVAGLSAYALRSSMVPEGAAMRLPAQVLAGVGVSLLLFTAWAWGGGLTGGLLAAGWFILLPRVAFHAGLHTFDVPVAVATLAVALAYRASLRRARWGWAVGPMLGVAIAIKHNALFLGPLLALHYYACLAWGRWRHGHPIARAQWAPLPLWGMAILAPLVAWALWPWLWADPWPRLMDYVEFHRHHSWYNMEFLGQNYNQPPMPISYPLIMMGATVPATLLLLSVIGFATGLRAELRASPRVPAGRARWTSPLPPAWSRLDVLWLGLLGGFPLVLISWPTTPIFGGTKHWLTAYPFWALAAVLAWRELWRASGLASRRRWLAPAALVLVLGPAVFATANGHPYHLSQYAPLVGGPRGAASLGLNRGYWGHAIHGLWPTLQSVSGPIYLHDMHPLVRQQYVREGRWPQGLGASSVHRARTGLHFYERHMAVDEYALWEQLGTSTPYEVLSLDDVPLTSLYVEPDPHAAQSGP